MKTKLTKKEYVYVASMLFGLFFGAGNLIFPVHMGQEAGSAFLPATIGFIITGVGLPLIGVAALGMSRKDGLFELSLSVNRFFAYFFTCALYLSIGPFFAIPRCATTSFTVGIEHILPEGANMSIALLVFSFLFFAATLFFSLYPNKILTWVGKLLNPCFLLFLSILVLSSLLNPSISVSEVEVSESYVSSPFFKGFIEGYNTMDALASLAFGIIVVNVIKGLGVEDEKDVAKNTVLSGIYSCLLMALIYFATTLVGVQSRGLFAVSANGGIALAEIAEHYLGNVGFVILAITVTLACLKTSVGLITSCSETFSHIFKKGPKYKTWVFIFTLVSFLISNVGLTTIIEISVPVLMFLYPYTIVLSILSLTGKLYKEDRAVYNSVIAFTTIGSLYDFLSALPASMKENGLITWIIEKVGNILPFSSLGLGWVCPALLGLVVGVVIHITKSGKKATL